MKISENEMEYNELTPRVGVLSFRSLIISKCDYIWNELPNEKWI